MLIASIVGVENRSTVDMDFTLKSKRLSSTETLSIIQEVTSIDVGDGVEFRINRSSLIMGELDYPGTRIHLSALFEKMQIPLQVDVTSSGASAPTKEIHAYELLFEDREIHLLAYRTETVIAEKLETMLTRGVANTRMRDFYDIFALTTLNSDIPLSVITEAIISTSIDRGTYNLLVQADRIMDEILLDPSILDLWVRYQQKFDYARDISWQEISDSIKPIIQAVKKSVG